MNTNFCLLFFFKIKVNEKKKKIKCVKNKE
jgi:hypothetical protein